MASSFELRPFVTQTKALVKKNLLLLVRRKCFSTFFQVYFLPLLVILLCLNINNFGNTGGLYGIGQTARVQSLRSSLDVDNKDFVVVSNSTRGPDVAPAIQRLVEPLADISHRVFVLNSSQELSRHCVPNLRGLSNCHSVVVFEDSPETPGGSGNWSYTIRTDAAHHIPFSNDAFMRGTDLDTYWLVLQLAVDGAITNSTTPPLDIYAYRAGTQDEANEVRRQSFIRSVLSIFVFIFFLSILPIIFHTVIVVTTDRDLGLSQLIDAMGGGAAARVASYVVSLNLIHAPVWIICGILFWYYIFPSSNAAILLFWNLLVGVSITNASIFAASFFRRRRVGAVVVTMFFLLLACIASTRLVMGARDGEALACSLLFPAMNYVYSLARMGRFPYYSQPIDMRSTASFFESKFRGDEPDLPEHTDAAVYVYFVLAVLQIVIYPLLAIAAERLLHGISFRRRALDSPQESDDSFVAVATSQLKKVYPPSIWHKIFCCGRKSSTVTAVDGVDLVAHKNQILCLLGVNGSGKTTTLDLIGGLQGSTAGHVKIHAPSTQLGICPQRNVQHPELTVFEHVKFWSEVKGGQEDQEALHQLIEACDLTAKTWSRAGSLSGGQKRKLQLACMFVGGSTVCLMDEVTTGLDPLSRRTIWNIILAERSKRSMLFTTHFLDEGEVLADHIVLLSKGQIKCQGSSAELKSQFGGGYWVHVPRRGDDAPDAGVPSIVHQDRILYNTPDSRSAAKLIGKLQAAGETEVDMHGPTIESVFLRLTQDVDESEKKMFGVSDGPGVPSTAGQSVNHKLVSGHVTSSFRQILVLTRKRVTILPRYWVAPFLALLIGAVLPGLLAGFLKQSEWPTCDTYAREAPMATHQGMGSYWFAPGYDYSGGSSYTPAVAVGPPSVNASLAKVMSGSYPVLGAPFNMSAYSQALSIQDSFGSLQNIVKDDTKNYTFRGAIWMGDDSAPATIAFDSYGPTAISLINLWTSVRTGAKIGVATGSISTLVGGSSSTGLIWTLFVAAVFALYPCFFALYPAFEKSHKIRALQYANGVRPFPLWMSHLLVDSVFVICVSMAITVAIQKQFSSFWFAPGYIFVVSCLYGLACILVAYHIARISRSQPAAFLSTLGVMMVMFLGTTLAYILPSVYIGAEQIQQATDAISFALGLVMPSMNLWKAFAVGMNLFKVLCRSEQAVTNPGSIFAYGGPILLLIIQVIFLALLLVWLESSHSFDALRDLVKRGRRRSAKEEAGLEAKDGIAEETARVASDDTDLLRMVHLSKSFGSNTAVDDVSLGLGQGEILALLGPNGAGKTTMANMIMGELRPDGGHIYLRGVDVHKHTRQAQRSLGVCPQFDALDLMTARQHLEFYARVKGIKDVRNNVEIIMEKLGLAPHADKPAYKLSGGNKRKLSLSIALIGNPDVLILDEPSSAMDAAAKRVMWKVLADIAPGRSVLLTTHSMEEADALATRAAIISRRLLAIGTTQVLRQRYSNFYHVALVLKSAPTSSDAEMARVEQWVKTRFRDVRIEGDCLGGQVKFTLPNASSSSSSGAGPSASDGGEQQQQQQQQNGSARKESTIGQLIETLEEHREELGLEDYSIGAPTLERVFLSVVRENDVEEEDESSKKRWWKF